MGHPSRRTLLKSVGAAGAAALLHPGRGCAQSAAPLLLDVHAFSADTVRLILRRDGDTAAASPADDGALLHPDPGPPLARLRAHPGEQTLRAGSLRLFVSCAPFSVRVENNHGALVQSLTLVPDPAALRFTLALPPGPVLGLGEGGPQFDKRGALDRMVSGSGGYQLSTHGSKVPIQWLMTASGAIFLHHPLGQFDLRADPGVFLAPPPAPGAPLLDAFVVGAATPAARLAAYAAITGSPEMPPLWSLGYLQSHRTLGTPDEIRAEIRTFRDKRLPCDAMIYLGTGFCPNGWNTANGAFEWNSNAFPDPAAAIAALHADNSKVVVHIVLDGRQLDGAASDPCPVPVPELPQRPQRDLGCYWPLHKPLFDLGVDGWWPDEGDGFDAPSRLRRNRMYFEGAQMYRPNRRVFALHRNGYAGMQRYASFLWSGDVQSTWLTLKTQIAVGLNAGLSGLPWWGTDIGGFVPTAQYTGELFARWFQFGAFCPLFRSHGRDWRLHLPWGWNTGDLGVPETPSYHPDPAELHNPAVEPICRQYLELRYRLLPYLYSAVRASCDTGLPVMRALWIHYPDDAAATARDDEYLFGPDLLVAPVVEKAATSRSLYLPAGDWYDFWTSERLAGQRAITRPIDLATLPLYVRAGAILPIGPAKQWTAEPSAEPLTLRLHPGADGAATWYEDDGDTFNFRRGEYMKVDMTWHDRRRQLELRLAKGAQPPATPRAFQVQIAGAAASHRQSFAGAPITIRL